MPINLHYIRRLQNFRFFIFDPTFKTSTARAAQKAAIQCRQYATVRLPRYTTQAAGRVSHCGHSKNTSKSSTKATPTTNLKLHGKIKDTQQKNYNTEYNTFFNSGFNSLLKASNAVCIAVCLDKEFHLWTSLTRKNLFAS